MVSSGSLPALGLDRGHELSEFFVPNTPSSQQHSWCWQDVKGRWTAQDFPCLVNTGLRMPGPEAWYDLGNIKIFIVAALILVVCHLGHFRHDTELSVLFLCYNLNYNSN